VYVLAREPAVFLLNGVLDFQFACSHDFASPLVLGKLRRGRNGTGSLANAPKQCQRQPARAKASCSDAGSYRITELKKSASPGAHQNA
jgi:hypothetical protein